MIKKLMIILLVLSVSSVMTASATPVVKISDANISDIGSTANLDITLSEAPNGLSGFNMSVSLSNQGVAEIVGVSFPTLTSLHSNSPLPAGSVWLKAVDISSQVQNGASNVILAVLTVKIVGSGSTDVTATITKMEDDNGSVISPDIISGRVGLPVSATVTKAAPASASSGSSRTVSPAQTNTVTATPTIDSTGTPVSTMMPESTVTSNKEKPPDVPLEPEIPGDAQKTPDFQIVTAILGLIAIALTGRKK